jgi:hypothetical protein
MQDQYKTVESIPSDEPIEMTPLLHRLFDAGGCYPACHGCWNPIQVGQSFKLASVNLAASVGAGTDKIYSETKEVMICTNCTVEDTQKNQDHVRTIAKENFEKFGCYRVNGKISKQ